MRVRSCLQTAILCLPFLVGCGGGSSSSPPNSTPAILVTISPMSASVTVNGIQQFTATVSNASNTSVSWQVNDISGGNSSVGMISSSGLYQAPPAAPNPATVTIRAVSQADASKSGSATVTVTAAMSGVNNALLNGQYAFSWFGSDNTSGIFVAGGIFAADGNGHITNGVEDGNFADGVFLAQPFSGTYSIGADGRGTATLTTPHGQVIFKFAVASSSLARFIEFDGTAAGKGVIEKQDPSAFSITALNGDYAFLLDGLDCAPGAPCAESMSATGRFTANAGTFSQGIADVNHQSTAHLNQSLGGSYSVGSNGRGTADFVTPEGTWNTVFYVISASKLRVVGTDIFPVLLGTAQRQSGGPFTNASVAGDYVFGLTVTSPVRPEPVILAKAGWTHADGAGALSNGLFDENGGAGDVSSGVGFQGTYSVESNGRVTGAIITSAATTNWVFYVVSPSELYMMQVDPSTASSPNLVTSGEVLQQQGGPFSTPSLVGDFAFFASGKPNSSAGVNNTSGVFSADGAGGLPAITLDEYLAGTLSSDQSLTGTYSVADTSRGIGTASLGSRTAHLYFISPSKALLIGMDSTELFLGIAEKRQ